MVRRLVAEHPIASFLVFGNAVAWAFATPPAGDVEFWYGRPLNSLLGTILGVGLAAFAVTAIADGRAAVVDLLHRSFRWRVPLRWYALAAFWVPVATITTAALLYGADAFESPPEGWARIVGIVLVAFVIQLVLFQFAEEVAFTGFLQDRLHARYSAVKLTAVVAFFWALWHVPWFFADEGWGLEQAVSSVVFFAIEFFALFFARAFIVWLYHRTGRSVLLVVVFHASFDATISDLAERLIPDSNAVRFLLLNALIVLVGTAVIVATRGRFATDRDEELRPAATPA